MKLWIVAPVIDPHDCLPPGELDLGAGVKVETTPGWAQEALKLAKPTERELFNAKRSLIYTYEGEGIGSDQKHVEVTAVLKSAMISLWIRYASPLFYSVALHARPGEGEVLVFAFETDLVFKPNERYGPTKLTLEQISEVRLIHERIRNIYLNARDRSDNSLGVALRFCAQALADRWWQSRFLLLWVCLEALFGSETEVSYRLALRTANFLADNSEDRREVFELVREGYNWRSRLAHGRPLDPKERERSSEVMYATEGLLQNSMRKIFLDTPSFIEVFGGPNRGPHLDSLAFR